MITNEQLRKAFVTPAMRRYFHRKLASLPSVQVDVRIEETLKFLNIAVYWSGNIPVSQEIDELWHFWILETRQYQALCAGLHGGVFVHHSSNDYVTDAEWAALAQEGLAARRPDDSPAADIEMLRAYVLNYGPFEADRVRYWNLARFLVRRRNWTLDRLNRTFGPLPPTRERVAPEVGGQDTVVCAARGPQRQQMSRATPTTA